MASSWSTRLRLELQADGENDTTWGQKLNAAIALLDEAIGGYLAINAAGSSNITLTTSNGVADQTRQRVLKFTGVLTGSINVICPTVEGYWNVWNATTGAFTLTFKTSAGTGISIPQGGICSVFCDGTNVERGESLTGLGVTAAAASILDDATTAAMLITLGASGLGPNLFTGVQSWDKGGDIASAGTLVLGADGNLFDVTGTTTITAFTVPLGTWFALQFDAALQLTHDGDGIILPHGASWTTEAGDMALCFAHAANKVTVHPLPKNPAKRIINAQIGTTYSFALTDVGKYVTLTNSAAIAATVPANATVAFPIGSQIDGKQGGAGQVTITAAVGVTINSLDSYTKLAAVNAGFTLIKVGTNTWDLHGALSA